MPVRATLSCVLSASPPANGQAEAREHYCGTQTLLFCHVHEARTCISTPNSSFPCTGPASGLFLCLSNLFKDSHVSLEIAVKQSFVLMNEDLDLEDDILKM